MTSYNRVNGRWCSEDRDLLEGVLRGDLGFEGLVMTDWFAVGSTLDSARAGLDLQMPGPDRFFGEVLAKAVADGDLEPEVLDGIARRWLSLIDKLDAWEDEPGLERAVDLPEHRAVAHRAGLGGTVLLSNNGVLPLPATGTVALIGPLAARAHVMGGGSAQLRAHRSPSLYDVLAPQLGDRLTFERGCDIDKTIRPLAVAGTSPGAVRQPRLVRSGAHDLHRVGPEDAVVRRPRAGAGRRRLLLPGHDEVPGAGLRLPPVHPRAGWQGSAAHRWSSHPRRGHGSTADGPGVLRPGQSGDHGVGRPRGRL